MSFYGKTLIISGLMMILILTMIILIQSRTERYHCKPVVIKKIKKIKKKQKPRFKFKLSDPRQMMPEPRLLTGFLSEEEVNALIEESDKHGFHISMVEDNRQDKKVRVSETCWLYPDKIPTLAKIYQRVLALPYIQSNNEEEQYTLEPLQVVKYGSGGHYSSHYDQCYDDMPYCKKQMKDFNGPRKWTLIMYLTDEYDGGETYFPNLNRHIKGQKGDALLFHTLTMDNTMVHPLSLHQGSEVSNGEKRIANVWIRTNAVDFW